MTVYIGAVAPESFEIIISRGASSLDLSTVTAATLAVSNPDRTTTTWAASISAQSATSLTLTHTFLVGETVLPGDYHITPQLAVPAGTHRAERVILPIEDPNRR